MLPPPSTHPPKNLLPPTPCNLGHAFPGACRIFWERILLMTQCGSPNGTFPTPSTSASCSLQTSVPLCTLCPPLPTDISTLLCIDLVLPMGLVNFPDMLCASTETVADVDNGYLLGPTLVFEIYPPTAVTYSLDPSPTASASRLHYVDVYIDDFNFAN